MMLGGQHEGNIRWIRPKVHRPPLLDHCEGWQEIYLQQSASNQATRAALASWVTFKDLERARVSANDLLPRDHHMSHPVFLFLHDLKLFRAPSWTVCPMTAIEFSRVSCIVGCTRAELVVEVESAKAL